MEFGFAVIINGNASLLTITSELTRKTNLSFPGIKVSLSLLRWTSLVQCLRKSTSSYSRRIRSPIKSWPITSLHYSDQLQCNNSQNKRRPNKEFKNSSTHHRLSEKELCDPCHKKLWKKQIIFKITYLLYQFSQKRKGWVNSNRNESRWKIKFLG